MMNRIGGNPNIVLAVTGDNRITAIGIPRTPRKVAAGHVDFDPAAGSKDMMDVAKIEG